MCLFPLASKLALCNIITLVVTFISLPINSPAIKIITSTAIASKYCAGVEPTYEYVSDAVNTLAIWNSPISYDSLGYLLD